MKSIKYLFPFLISLFFLQFNGCNELNSIPLNIPITINITTTGNSSSISKTESFCIDTLSNTYQEYESKIQSIKFVQAAYRTISISSPSLQGDITLILWDGDGNQLFKLLLPATSPVNYMQPNPPFVLQLNQSQIALINSYIGNLNNKCFKVTLTIDNISGGSIPYTVSGAVDMVFQADTEL